jgi:hypothetical protein
MFPRYSSRRFNPAEAQRLPSPASMSPRIVVIRGVVVVDTQKGRLAEQLLYPETSHLRVHPMHIFLDPKKMHPPSPLFIFDFIAF